MCCGDVDPSQSSVETAQDWKSSSSQISRRTLIKSGTAGAAVLASPISHLGYAQGSITVGVTRSVSNAQIELLQQGSSGTQAQVEIVRINETAALQAALETGDLDIAVDLHVRGEDLFRRGMITTYCRPGSRCADICASENAPRWCRYAQGRFDQVDSIPGFGPSTLCEPVGCPECRGPNAPEWCKVVDRFPQTRSLDIDLIQVGLSGINDNNIFPFGIPAWWDFYTFLGNSRWFENRGIRPPRTIAEVNDFAAEFPEQVFTTRNHLSVFEQFAPSPVPDIYTPEGRNRITTVDSFQQIVAEMETNPNAVAMTSAAVGLDLGVRPPSDLGFGLLPLADFRPGIYVTGMYMSPHTQSAEQALEFMYDVGRYPEIQDQVSKTGQIPALWDSLSPITNGRPVPFPAEPITEKLPETIGYAVNQGLLISGAPEWT